MPRNDAQDGTALGCREVMRMDKKRIAKAWRMQRIKTTIAVRKEGCWGSVSPFDEGVLVAALAGGLTGVVTRGKKRRKRKRLQKTHVSNWCSLSHCFPLMGRACLHHGKTCPLHPNLRHPQYRRSALISTELFTACQSMLTIRDIQNICERTRAAGCAEQDKVRRDTLRGAAADEAVVLGKI